MEWRCEWCGKPHAENDPPCDNCGHGRFEKAVVQMGPAETDATARPVWTCAECGRDHEKHSPPCSRCGNVNLERREREYRDVETTGATGWLDVLDRKYAAGFAVVGVLALVLGLGMVGVVDVPGLGPPSPPDAPGSAEEWRGLSLAETEEEVVTAINEDRETAGTDTLDTGETLGAMATYYNARRVEADHTDADPPSLSELDPFEPRCGSRERITVVPTTALTVDGVESVDSAAALAEILVRSGGSLGDDSLSNTIAPATGLSSIGVDVHAGPDDDLYVTVVAC